MTAPARMRTAVATGALLLAVAAACGAQPPTAEPTPPPTATAPPAPASPQPTSTIAPAPTSTPTPTAASPQPTSTTAPTPAATATATDTAGWRTDVEAGGRIGNAAPNATVTLTGGTTVTLEELAGGKPLLLYFFATW